MRKTLPCIVGALVLFLAGCSEPASESADTDQANNGAANNGANNGASNNGIDAEFTFHRDIEPLLEAQCNQCHQDGGIAPFTFSTYEDVRAQAPAIAAAVADGSMPPWLPNDGCGGMGVACRLARVGRRAKRHGRVHKAIEFKAFLPKVRLARRPAARRA